MFEWLVNLGIYGYISILITAVLLIVAVSAFGSRNSRKLFLLIAIMSFSPLALGLLATNIGQRDIEEVKSLMEATTPISDEELADAEALAMRTTYLGIGSTILLLLVSGIGLAIKVDREE